MRSRFTSGGLQDVTRSPGVDGRLCVRSADLAEPRHDRYERQRDRRRAGARDRARTQIASTVSQAEVKNLPMNGRNFLDLAFSSLPGVSPTNTASTQLFAETSAVPEQGMSGRQPAQLLEQLHRGWRIGQRRRRRPERNSVRRGRGGSVPGGHVRGTGGTGARPRWLHQRGHEERRERSAWRHGYAVLSLTTGLNAPNAILGQTLPMHQNQSGAEPRRPDRPRSDVLFHEHRTAPAGSVRACDDLRLAASRRMPGRQRRHHQYPARGSWLSGFHGGHRRVPEPRSQHQFSRQDRPSGQRQRPAHGPLQPVQRYVGQLAGAPAP